MQRVELVSRGGLDPTLQRLDRQRLAVAVDVEAAVGEAWTVFDDQRGNGVGSPESSCRSVCKP
jgi:hypothetical protein